MLANAPCHALSMRVLIGGSRRPSQKVKVLKPQAFRSFYFYSVISRRPSQKVKVLKPAPSRSNRHQITAGSQTFPEGKGVETFIQFERNEIQVRSQTFPEGKGVETGWCPPLGARWSTSQTFPEGKGVETDSSGNCPHTTSHSRRPSQKVKVLKLPQSDPPHTPDNPQCRRPSQKVKVLKLRYKGPKMPLNLCRRPSQKVKVLKLAETQLQ